MNVERIDIGKFVFFLNTFTGNGGCEYSHHHDDLLSYSVFADDEEILVDPGRPTYQESAPWTNSEYHNGISSPGCVLRPVSRFYIPRNFSRNTLRLSVTKKEGFVEASAVNRLTNVCKTLTIVHSKDRVSVSETLTKGGKQACCKFSHFVPHGQFTQSSTDAVLINGKVSILYGRRIHITQRYRAIAYGESEEVYHIHDGGDLIGGEWKWELLCG